MDGDSLVVVTEESQIHDSTSCESMEIYRVERTVLRTEDSVECFEMDTTSVSSESNYASPTEEEYKRLIAASHAQKHDTVAMTSSHDYDVTRDCDITPKKDNSDSRDTERDAAIAELKGRLQLSLERDVSELL